MAITAAFPLSFDAHALLKRTLHASLPAVPSSHLAEAIARGLGFQTNAALQPQLRAGGVAPFDPELFSGRLVELGHEPSDVGDDARMVLSVLLAQADPGLTPRTPLERCAAYGVQLMRKENGEVFAHHNVGGVVGPCRDEHEAAELACATWSL
jgi:hypothetical protein